MENIFLKKNLLKLEFFGGQIFFVQGFEVAQETWP